MNLDKLHVDIIYYICSFLNPKKDFEEQVEGIKNIISLSHTSGRLFRILNNEKLWKDFYCRDLSDMLPEKKIKKKYYKAIDYLISEDVKNTAAERGYEKIIHNIDKDDIEEHIVLTSIASKNIKMILYLYDIMIDNIKNNKNADEKFIENELGGFNGSVIYYIIKCENIELLKIMENKGFKYDIIDAQNTAAKHDRLNILLYLEKKQSFSPELIRYAAGGGNLKIVQYVVKNVKYIPADIDDGIKVTINIKIIKYLWSLSSQNVTNLYHYLYHITNIYEECKFEDIKYLLKLGIDIHWDNEAILRKLCKDKDLEAVKYCLKKGANINVRNGITIKTPLIIAASNGHNNIVEYLIDEGADLKELNGISVLHIKGIHPETYKLILKLRRQKKLENPKEEKRPYTLPKGKLCKGKTAKGDNCKKPASCGDYCYIHIKNVKEN